MFDPSDSSVLRSSVLVAHGDLFFELPHSTIRGSPFFPSEEPPSLADRLPPKRRTLLFALPFFNLFLCLSLSFLFFYFIKVSLSSRSDLLTRRDFVSVRQQLKPVAYPILTTFPSACRSIFLSWKRSSPLSLTPSTTLSRRRSSSRIQTPTLSTPALRSSLHSRVPQLRFRGRRSFGYPTCVRGHDASHERLS